MRISLLLSVFLFSAVFSTDVWAAQTRRTQSALQDIFCSSIFSPADISDVYGETHAESEISTSHVKVKVNGLIHATNRADIETFGDAGFIQESLKRGQIFCSYLYQEDGDIRRSGASVTIQGWKLRTNRHVLRMYKQAMRQFSGGYQEVQKKTLSNIPVSLIVNDKQNMYPNEFQRSSEIYFVKDQYFFIVDFSSSGDIRNQSRLERSLEELEEDASGVVENIISRLQYLHSYGNDSASQMAKVRNAQREANINTFMNAIYMYSIDNSGNLPFTSQHGQIVKICKQGVACEGLRLDHLIETYMIIIPNDPSQSESAKDTGYILQVTPTGITINAPFAEAATIALTR
jgi:hypothetical protein